MDKLEYPMVDRRVKPLPWKMELGACECCGYVRDAGGNDICYHDRLHPDDADLLVWARNNLDEINQQADRTKELEAERDELKALLARCAVALKKLPRCHYPNGMCSPMPIGKHNAKECGQRRLVAKLIQEAEALTNGEAEG